MRRCGLVLSALAFAIAACSQSSTPTVSETPQPTGSPVVAEVGGPRIFGAGTAMIPPSGPMTTASLGGPGPGTNQVPDSLLTDSEQKQRHDATLNEAMERLAERRWAEALAAFEIAERLQPNETTRRAIDRLRRRIEQESTAEQTATDIQAILDDGRADEAADLAREAIRQFGHTEMAERLNRLKRQADALAALSVADRSARFVRFRREYDEAMKEDNRRAAAVALEQALQNGDDAALRERFDALTADLARHDQLRAQAAELKRQPGKIAEALIALEEAAKIWDSPSVRQEIEDCRTAIMTRRERMSVADFEVRGDIGVPQAGAFVADELLPAFRGRYDLVERRELTQVIDELNLLGSLGGDEAGCREVGRAAHLDFLVVGSITPIAGLTVHARLVNVRTGLIVQTARLVAPTIEELKRGLPRLAQDLLLSDEQRQAIEQDRDAEEADVPMVRPDPALELPPPEPPLREVPLPAPIIPARVKAPRLADREQFIRRFDQLPPPPPPGQVLPELVLPVARDRELRERALLVALELGDNQFRRGLYQQAYWHYEFALNLFPGHLGVRLRLERCRPLLPIVLDPAPIATRVAAVDFAVAGNPAFVPPWLSEWLPERLAPYLLPEFRVIDRSELFWWMGRLGITPDQVLYDPVARLYLGRALNVRYFLFGTVTQAALVNVTTYLIDAEFGFLVSSARIPVRGTGELNLRLAELAWLTKLTPEQRRAVEDEGAQWTLLLNEVRTVRLDRNWARLTELCHKGLRLRPQSVELQVYLAEAEERQREYEYHLARERERAAIDVQLRRQMELARRAEEARLRAAQLAQADRRRLEAQQMAAAEDMARRAQVMLQANRFAVAIQLFESATALRPDDESLYRELALARARAEEAARADAAEASARREAELRRQREAELARARAQLEAERLRRAQEEQARRRGIEERDRREYDRLMGLAQTLSAGQQYEEAVAAAQKAKQLRPTPEADRLVTQLLIDVARVNAEKRGAAEKEQLERQLAAERQARQAAEAEAARNRQMYESLLVQGQQYLKAEKFDEAEEQFRKAGNISRTDAVLTGLNQSRIGKQRMQARLQAERENQAELQRQNDLLKVKLAEAQAALSGRRSSEAVTLFREAKQLAPTNVDVLAGLARAEQMLERETIRARRENEERTRRENFQKLLVSGKASLAAGKFDAAVLALGEAVKLDPTNAEAKAALTQAETQAGADAAKKEQLKRMAEDFERHMRDGRRYLALKQYERALTAFRAAREINRDDKAVNDFIQEATDAMAAESQAREMAVRRGADLSRFLVRFRTALSAGKLDDAQKALSDAARIDANNREVVQAQAELRKAQEAAENALKATRQKEEQFADRLNRARTALSQKNFDEAAAAVAEALQLKPNDSAAKVLQTQVNRAKSESSAMQRQEQVKQLVAQARAAMTAKKLDETDALLDQAEALAPRDPAVIAARADLKKMREAMAASDADVRRKQQAYTAAMKAARELLQAGKHDDAAKSVAIALQQSPQDRDALALQRQIEEAKKAASAAMSAEQKRKEFTRLLAEARTALKANKIEDANRNLTAALRIFPKDDEALALQKEIDEAKSSAAAMVQKRQEYGRAMQQGRTAMLAKRYADAIKAFESALNAIPDDPAATKALADAKKAAETPPKQPDTPMPPQQPDTPMPMGKPAVYTQLMQQGANQERAGRHELALRAYQAALRAVANDADAQKKVEFCQLMVAADAAMKQRKFPDARSAYESALKLFPADANARAGLQRAMTAK